MEERFNLRKQNELEVKKHYETEITNRFAALENWRDEEEINRAWGTLNRTSKPQPRTARIEAAKTIV